MGRKPAPSKSLDRADTHGKSIPPDPKHAKPKTNAAMILKFIGGLLMLLTIAVVLGTSLKSMGIGGTPEQTIPNGGGPVNSSAASASGAADPKASPSASFPTPSLTPPATLTPTMTPSPTPCPEIRASITAVGDIIMHKAVTDGGVTNPGKGVPVYDFNPDFQYISSIFKNSNLAMGNFEGTLFGPPYTGFPSFCAPDAIADALYTAGFRVICTANNHCIDKGYDGLVRTASVFRSKGFTVIGTRPDITSPMDTIADLDGIKVGMLNYTFETPGTEQRKSINGIPIPDGADQLIDSFNPYRESSYNSDMSAILLRAGDLRSHGAEIICLTLHWGEEYQTHSVAWQQKMAQQLCDAGIELIIGHHPHVLEEIDVLTCAATGKQTLVYYSLGNFLGNWNFGTLGTSGKAEDGMIARITFLKTQDGVSIEKGEYIPTFIVRLPKGAGLQHLIVPVLPALYDPAAYRTTTAEMQASYNRIGKILGPCVGSVKIPVIQAAS